METKNIQVDVEQQLLKNIPATEAYIVHSEIRDKFIANKSPRRAQILATRFLVTKLRYVQ